MKFKAEELMRKIEREEDKLPFETPEKKVFHLCIVNLVIGYKNIKLTFLILDFSLFFFQEHCIVQKIIMNLVYHVL